MYLFIWIVRWKYIFEKFDKLFFAIHSNKNWYFLYFGAILNSNLWKFTKKIITGDFINLNLKLYYFLFVWVFQYFEYVQNNDWCISVSDDAKIDLGLKCIYTYPRTDQLDEAQCIVLSLLKNVK